MKKHRFTESPPAIVQRPIRFQQQALLLSAVAVAALMHMGPCAAMEIPVGIDDVSVRWDNTVKYSAADRLKSASRVLTSPAANPSNVNLDDGDRNFKRGIISNRFDILSEFDARYKDFGLRVTGAAWYDSIYNERNDNPGFAGGAAPNQTSVPYNHFTRQTRKIHGRDAEVLDAFVYGAADVGDTRASFRLGRHAMVWGETLFFGANGIAGGMMPDDVVKLLSVPSTQFKEAIRPVPMLSGNWALSPSASIGAYYQFQWAASRIPLVGSYFSVADTVPDGAEQALLAGPGSPFLANAPRLADQRPKNSGQGGLQFRTNFAETDLGLYLIRYHDKTPQQIFNFGAAPVVAGPGPTCSVPNSFSTGGGTCALVGPVSYQLVYPENITSFGASASKTFGGVNLATEVSFRNNQPLNSSASVDTSRLTGAPSNDNNHNPAYPVARTAHANISTIWSVPSGEWLREASFAGELGWNTVMKVTRNRQALEPNATRSSVAVRGVFQNTYRQVVTGLDIAPLLGLGWAPKGSRSPITTTSLPQHGNGDMTLGVDFTYQDAWRANLAYTHYLGGAGSFLTSASQLSYKQPFADRDFIAFSVRRSF